VDEGTIGFIIGAVAIAIIAPFAMRRFSGRNRRDE